MGIEFMLFSILILLIIVDSYVVIRSYKLQKENKELKQLLETKQKNEKFLINRLKELKNYENKDEEIINI